MTTCWSIFFNFVDDKARSLVFFLNQPPVKKAVKKTVGAAHLVFAAWEVYESVKKYRKEEILLSHKECFSTRLTVLTAKISMIGFALSTAPGYQIAGSVASFFFSEETLSRWVGPHLNFATTPYHPRHVVSVASFALGIPAFIHFVYMTL